MAEQWYVPYEENAGAVCATGRIGPFTSREEAVKQTDAMIDRYPYWEPTGEPEQEAA